MHRFLTISVALLALAASSRTFANVDLTQCARFIVLDEKNEYGASYYHNKLKQFLAQDTSSSYGQAKSSATKIGIELDGIPMSFENKNKQSSWSEYRQALRQSSYHDIVSRAEWSNTFVGLGAASASLADACIKHLAAANSLHASVQPSIASGYFVLKVRFPNGTTRSTSVPRFAPPSAVSNCSALALLESGAQLPPQGVDVQCQWDSKQSVQILLGFEAGNLQVELPAVPPEQDTRGVAQPKHSPIAVTMFDGNIYPPARRCDEHCRELVCSNDVPGSKVVGKAFDLPSGMQTPGGWRVFVEVASLQSRPVTINVNDKWVKPGLLQNVTTGGWSCKNLAMHEVGVIPAAYITPGRNEVVISTNGTLPHIRSVQFVPIN